MVTYLPVPHQSKTSWSGLALGLDLRSELGLTTSLTVILQLREKSVIVDRTCL